MATNKEELFNKVNGSKWNTGVVFERTNPGPIEKYSVFQTLAEAQNYASTNAVAYVGQIITVVGGTETYTAWTFSDGNTHTMEYAGGKWTIDGVATTSKNVYDLTATATISGSSVTATRQIATPYTITPYKITDTSGTLQKVDMDIIHASKSDFGIVKVGDNVEVNDGVISVKVASKSDLGVVKIGTGLDVTADGTISAQKLSVDQDFTDPTSENPVSTKAVHNELTAHYVNKDVVEGTATSTDKIQKKSDVSVDIKKAIEDLDYVGITAQQGEFISAISETDGIVTAQKGTIALPQANVVGLSEKLTSIDGDITSLKNTDEWLSGYAETKAQEAETSAKNYADAVVSELSTKFETVSADHETRITTSEGKIEELSSKVSGALHFKGMATTEELSTGWTGTPVPPYAKSTDKPQDGDVVIRLSDSREFVWGSEQWNELGAEAVWATQAALDAEVERAKGVEGGLRTDVDTISANLGTVSADLDTLEGQFETLTATTLPLSVQNLLSAISDEKTAREGADTAINGRIDTLSGESILSIKLNDQYFDFANNVASISISCINCGGAN